MRTLGLALAAALGATPAIGGRPLSTEDVAVLADKSCQVEAWVDRTRDITQSWMVPACNFGAGIEWQLGGARSREDGRSFFAESYFQAKKVLRALDQSPWGVGLVLGVTRRPLQESHRGWENPYVTLPVTLSYADGATLLHFNVGASRDRAQRRIPTQWGIGVEHSVATRVALVAEAFGENARSPYLRAGARYSAIPNQLDLDLTAVTRPNGGREDRFVSLGLTFTSARFLP